MGGSQIEGNHKKQLKQSIVEYNDIFARHRLDIGINNSFKVKLTPKDERPIYTQSLPVPINLKEDLTTELALMHRYGLITTLPFSKHESPIFAQANQMANCVYSSTCGSKLADFG